MAGAGEKTKIHGWTGKVLLRYTLFQIPGLIALILILIVVRHWIDLPPWLAYVIIAVWVIKDITLFPFVWNAYDMRSEDANLRMIGDKGVAQELLNPSGFVLIHGELWKAEIAEGSPPIPKGTLLRVKEIHGLNLIVKEEAK